jgi:hypothetical protein
MLEERERRLAAVHAAIERVISDIEAGRVRDAKAVFDELEARYARMAGEHGEMGQSVPWLVTGASVRAPSPCIPSHPPL